MSRSPDAPQGENLAVRPNTIAQSFWASRNSVLTLLKGLLWIAIAIAATTVLAMNYELVWDVLAEIVPTVLEVLEEALDTFFESVFRLNPTIASMATAYTGFVLFLIVFYLLARKGVKVYQKAQVKKSQLAEVYTDAWAQLYGNMKAAYLSWWASLDTINKAVAIVAFVLLGIPLALLLSVILGSLVADLLL